MAFSGTTRFQILGELGHGSMGVVYHAYDGARNADVALKVLKHVDPANLYRFKREFRALRDFSHPNIVKLYELISDQDEWFFTMELVPGVDFTTYVTSHTPSEDDPTVLAESSARSADSATTRRTGDRDPELDTSPTHMSGRFLRLGGSVVPVPPHRTVFAANVDPVRLADGLQQLARALDALHRTGMVHRDLKPSNIRVTSEGRVVLMDFGIVAKMQQAASAHDSHMILGTPAYMAPEQLQAAPVTAAADWYAFGTLLYEAITGRRPFSGGPTEIMSAKSHLDPVPPRALVEGVPDALETLCEQLLRRDPSARPRGSDVFRALGIERHRESGIVATTRAFTTSFVGRDEELAALHACYEQARAGSIVFATVRGQSGMGKTYLVSHFLGELADRAAPGDEPIVLSGRCHERESLAYKAFDSVVDDLSDYLAAMPAAERAALLPDDAALIARLFPVLRDTVGEPSAFAGGNSLELRKRANAAFKALIARLVALRPIVMRIEDLQWADKDSLDLLEYLLAPPAPAPLLVVATMRSDAELVTTDTTRIRLAGLSQENVDIQLGRLSEHEQRQLVESLAQSHGQFAALGDALWRASDGHPMLLAELVRYVEGQTAELNRGGLSLENIMWWRIASLWPPARALLEALAVAGEPTPISVLAEASELSHEHRERAAALLAGSCLTRVVQTGHDLWLDVYHDKVRETVINRLSARQAGLWHRHLAEALEEWEHARPGLLARHWRAAGDLTKAALYLIDAAGSAAQQMASEHAASLYREALNVLGQLPGDRVLDRMRCKAWIGLAEGQRFTRGGDDALATLDHAYELASAHLFLDELACIHHLRGNLLFPRGDLDGCLREHESARIYAVQIGSAEREAQALGGLGDAYYAGGRMLSAQASYEACIALCRERDLVHIEAANLCMCGITRYFRNDVIEGLRHCEEAAALAERVGHGRGEAFARVIGAWCLFELGRFDDARREFEQSLTGMRRTGLRRYEPEALSYLAQIAWLEQRAADARAIAEQSVAICRETGIGFAGPFALGVLAVVADDDQARRRALDEGESVLRGDCPAHAHLWFYRYAMDAALALGDWDRVERGAASLEAFTCAEPLPWTEFYVKRARALAAHRRGARDPETLTSLREALAYAREARLEVAARAVVAALADAAGDAVGDDRPE